jgi:transposase-like protein
MFKMLKTREIKDLISELKRNRTRKCKICESPVRCIDSNSKTRFICTWKGCKRRFSVWEGTIFAYSKLSKTKTLKILEMWMQYAQNKLISYMTGVSKQAISRLIKRMSSLLVTSYYKNLPKIGGENVIVEIDESKFGKRKYNRGHRVEGIWILGMVERTVERKIRLVAVDDRKRETLQGLITEGIEPSSTIHTDCWRGYNRLIDNFSKHLTVNHSINYKDSETGCHTNTIEGNWAGIKLNVPRGGRRKHKIDLYLVRFMLRRNETTHPLHSLIKYLF